VCDVWCDVVVTSDGHVSAYYDGAFYPVCADNWSPAWSAGVCEHLGAGAVLSTTTVALNQSIYLTVANSSVYNISQLTLSAACNTSAGVQLVCHDASCGLSSSAIQPFIVGGQLAAENAWPWAAALLYQGSYQCTASVIGNGWLVTAAHCFFSVYPLPQRLSDAPQYFTVRLGSVLSRGYSRHLQVSSVKRIVVHPDYTVDASGFRYSDMALVQLGDDLLTPVTTTSTSSRSSVSPVCIADHQHQSLATLKTWQCYVIGWGLSSIDGNCEYDPSLFISYGHRPGVGRAFGSVCLSVCLFVWSIT